MLKKINNIFRPKGIFDFSHLHFDTVRAQSDGSGMEGKKVWSSGAEVHQTFSVAPKELRTFIMAYNEKTLKSTGCSLDRFKINSHYSFINV
jgi:hypothetical protein